MLILVSFDAELIVYIVQLGELYEAILNKASPITYF